jgi:predicted membrane channel-forming protein YqfA (hemolysin III family)
MAIFKDFITFLSTFWHFLVIFSDFFHFLSILPEKKTAENLA